MASFSNNSHPFSIDSIFSPNKQSVFSGFIEETENIDSNWFSDIESSMLVHGDNDLSSVVKKQHVVESTMVDDNAEQVTRIVTLAGKKRRTRNDVSLNSAQSKDAKEGKNKKKMKENTGKKPPEEPPSGYIHVRAKRGQATDTHSLAERVRRKKISERMEKLQRMVPGCDQLSGKALILDEIINYVESLEHQVEFLSKKAAALNTMFHEFGVDLEALMVKPEMVNNISTPPLSYLQQCNSTQPTPFVDTTTVNGTGTGTGTIFAPTNNIPLLDTSATLLFLQGQTPAVFPRPPQDDGSLLWEVDYLRQQFLYSSHSY